MIRKTPARRVNRRGKSGKHSGQQFLLQVRARHRKAVAQRNRRLFDIAFRFFLLLGLFAGLVYGGHRGLQALFFSNPDYALREIDIAVDGALTREQVLATTDLVPGLNIFSVKLDRLRERLENIPRVQAVTVERQLPDRIAIRITERRPVAWLASADADPFTSPHSYLVDARGIAMRPGQLQPEHLHLPVFLGLDPATMGDGQPVVSFALRTALELLRATSEEFARPDFRIRSIDLSKGYCMVVTDSLHGRYVFGFDELERQVERLHALLGHVAETGREIQTANLMLKRNLPVTFVPVVNDPEAMPETPSQ